MRRLTTAATWLALYAALAAGGLSVGRGLALHQRPSPDTFVLAAGSGNGNGHPPFGINSTPVTGLVPGGPAKPLTITLTNVDTVAYKLLTLQVDVNNPGGCVGSTNLAVSGLGRTNLLGAANRYDSSAPGAPQYEIPRKGSLTLTGVTIRLLDLPTNQNACKSKTFTISYSGTATQGSGIGS